jgi:hypothetical protein
LPPPPPPPTAMDGSVIGIMLACLSASMNAGGINLQRLGKRTGSAATSLVGVIMAVSCGGVDMLSFQFAAQSLLAPFASLGLLVNLVLARLMHGDVITNMDLVSTGLVVAGVVVCLLNSPQESPLRTPSELAALALDAGFLAWASLVLVVLGLAAFTARQSGSRSRQKIVQVSTAVVPGILGGGTVLSAKILTECGRAGAPNAVLGAVAGLAGLCGVGQTVALNLAVGKYSSLLVVPIFSATSLATNASGGGLFFQEFASFSYAQGGAYLCGVLVLLTGVLLLAAKGEDGKSRSATPSATPTRQQPPRASKKAT